MSSALSDEETTMPERGNEHGPGCDPDDPDVDPQQRIQIRATDLFDGTLQWLVSVMPILPDRPEEEFHDFDILCDQLDDELAAMDWRQWRPTGSTGPVDAMPPKVEMLVDVQAAGFVDALLAAAERCRQAAGREQALIDPSAKEA